MSILVMTTMTGTFRASAIPKCSLENSQPPDRAEVEDATYLLIPISPLLAATIRRQ